MSDCFKENDIKVKSIFLFTNACCNKPNSNVSL